ncbi:hypothetical protein ACFV4F_06635 [Kitasatospora sp. NPDC059722]
MRETLDLAADAQQLLVLLPAEAESAAHVDRLTRPTPGRLRVVS